MIAATSQAQVPLPVVVAETTGYPFSMPHIYGDGVAYFANLPSSSTTGYIYLASGGEISTIADFSTPYPAAPQFNFSAFYNLAGDGDNLYIVANSSLAMSGRYGLFRFNETGFTTLVADAGDLAPQAGFTGISGLKAGGGRVVFNVRQGSAYEAYYMHDGESLTELANNSTEVADNDGILLELPTVGAGISANGEHIVLRVKTGVAPAIGQSDRYTIYRYIDGELLAALNVGDALPQSFTVSNIPLQPVILNDGAIIANVHTIPSGSKMVVIHPDNSLTLLPEPTNGQGHTVRFSFSSGTNDGAWVYGSAAYYEGNAYRGGDPVRFDVDGNYEVLVTIPFDAAGKSWTSSSYNVEAADERGYIATTTSSDNFLGIFTNIPELAGDLPSSGNDSLWKDIPALNLWKDTPALGQLQDEHYPRIYAPKLGGWAWVHTEGATLQGFVVYSVSNQSWYFINEDLGGWAYRYAGGEADPGWVRL